MLHEEEASACLRCPTCIHFKGTWRWTGTEDSRRKEAAWKQLKPSLYCGQKEMEFRAAGHRAAEIQLDTGKFFKVKCVFKK